MANVKMKYKWKIWLGTLAAVTVCVFALFLIAVSSAVTFSEFDGQREFFTGRASSQGARKTELSVYDLGNVRGESVSFALEEWSDPSAVADKIAKTYCAEILFAEETGGVCSFYAYSPLWWDRIVLSGVAVNLHIAIDTQSGRCVVGSPIIFGGF